MKRLGDFVRRRGLGNTMTALGIVASCAGLLGMATRTIWHLPLVSNCLFALMVVCVACVLACLAWNPKGEESEAVTEIQTQPDREMPDPDSNPNSQGNVDATGPKVKIPRGSKVRVPRTAEVEVVPEKDAQNNDGAESDAPES